MSTSTDHTDLTPKCDDTVASKFSSKESEMNFDPKLIASWLDQHPQFLADYLRKVQMQRRNTILNDETSQLLSNFYSNLKLQTTNFSNSLHDGSQIYPNQAQPTTSANQFLGNNDEFLIDSRKKFRELTLYEKMYALVKALYQSLDLKTTCRKILKTVSLLLDADR
jgi:hypothetical protein